jgi:hypothetical protein
MEREVASINLNMHRVSQFRVISFYPDNSMSLVIRMVGEDGDVDLCLYGLPEDRAIQIAKALGDDSTLVYDGKSHITLNPYLEARGLFEVLEGVKKEGLP